MAKRRRYLSLTGKKRKETQVQLKARIAKAANTRRARTLAAKAAVREVMDNLGRHVADDAPFKFSLAPGAVNVIKEPEKPALRETLLKDGLALTMGSRNASYGDPFINFMLTARLKELFWDAMEASGKSVQQCSPWGHSVDMIFTNLARIATSPTTHLERDRYLDGSNYFALAYEVGVRSEK